MSRLDWRQVRRRLRLGSAPRSSEEEVDEEIRFHLAEHTEALRAEGMDPESARREAERRFGSIERRRRELRALTDGRQRATARRFSAAVWFEAFRSASRVFARRPLPAVAAILSLAFGLAAVAGVGTLADEILLRPPAGLGTPSELVYLDASPSSPLRVLETLYAALAPEVAFGGHLPGALFAVRGEAEPERGFTLGVDGGYFPVLRARPLHGRTLTVDDDVQRRQVVVVSHALALRHFPRGNAVGSSLRVEGRPSTIVGVAAPDFRGTFHGFPVDLWLPLSVAAELDDTFDPQDLAADSVELLARLPAEMDRDAFAARLDAELAGLRESHPELRDLRVEVHPLTGIDPELRRPLVAFVGLLAAAALGLLAVSASPVAMWLLARGQQRERELAIRSALGGSRLQLVLLLAAEGVWVGLLSGLAGLALAVPTPALASRLLPALPIDLGIVPTLRPGMLMAVLVAAMITGTVAALPAALRLRDASSAPMGERSGGGWRGAGRLVVAQLALACALLVVSGALVLGVRSSVAADPGIDLDRVAVAQRLDVGSLRPGVAERAVFYADLTRQAGELAGVDGSGLISRFPLSFFGGQESAVSAPGVDPELDLPAATSDPAMRTQMQKEILSAAVDAGYFSTVGIDLLRGRGFTSADDADAPAVAVINQTLAQRWFGAEGQDDALGRRLRIDGEVHVIVGVTATGRYRSVSEDDLPFIYRPVAQAPPPRIDLVLRSLRPTAELSADVRALLARLEPDLPSPTLLSGREMVAARLLPQRLAAGICAVLGAVGLLLASLAVYAVAAWRVGSRRHEFGVRLSLGASPADLRRAILLDGLRLAGSGLALGVGLGWLGARAAAGIVPGVGGAGPAVYLGVASALGVAALLAGIGPARRAGRIDPAEILRSDVW